MNRISHLSYLLVAVLSFVAGAASLSLLDSSHAQAQQAELPPVFQPNGKVFLQVPEDIAKNAYTIREVYGPWVQVEIAGGGRQTYQRYWVYGPSLAWGVEGAFQPAPQP